MLANEMCKPAGGQSFVQWYNRETSRTEGCSCGPKTLLTRSLSCANVSLALRHWEEDLDDKLQSAVSAPFADDGLVEPEGGSLERLVS